MVTINIISQLVGMGFPLEGVGEQLIILDGRGIEAAMEWVLQHSANPGWLS